MKVEYIELLGSKHPLCFSLAAAEKLDELFGGLDKMQEEIFCGEVRRVAKAADAVLQALLDAGRIYMAACGEELPPKLSCRPADVIDVTDGQAVGAIFSTIKNDSAQEVQTEAKNGEAAQGR